MPEDTQISPDSGSMRKMFDRVSELGKIGVWECDLATEKLTWTSAVYDLFDMPHGAVVDRAMSLACYEPASRREMERRRAEAIATCSSFTVDVAIRTRAMNKRWIRISGDVEQENGRATRIFGTKQDITREKEAQLKLQALQSELIHLSRLSAIDVMGSTLAHELNQPLAAIAIYTAALKKELGQSGGDGAKQDILEGIERCALKSGDILRSIRRISVGKTHASTVFDINAEIVEACRIAFVAAPADIQVEYELSDGLTAFGDPVQIQQVMINLIRNACEAMENSEVKNVTIRTVERDGCAEVSVRDTGAGLAPTIQDTLFQPFVSSRPDGTGIGLAICRTIIEAHSGRLRAENNVDGGATFCFNVPLTGNV